jgi:hypothetical protein
MREGYPPWRFEIVMHGHGRYYRKEWSQPDHAERGEYRVHVLLDDFYGSLSGCWTPEGSLRKHEFRGRRGKTSRGGPPALRRH